MSWTHSLVFPIVLIGTIFTALDGGRASKFILSARLASSEMIFFPGTHDASKTEIIDVYDGKPLSELAVRVPRSSQSK